ncbi:MAG: nucleotidyltransferase family protein [Pseudomonadota bacterium]|nr:MAG: nucleotidyltransferase family protein [Pseudomonadota bacterium]
MNIHGILLAAGSAQRFGAQKLLHTLDDDTPMAVAAARRLLAVLPEAVAVVRSDATDVKRALSAAGMRIVENPDAARGIGTSVACGVAHNPGAEACVVALADMPFLTASSIAAVCAALEDGAPLAAPRYRGQRGHPVGFACDYFDELLVQKSDIGARQVLVRHARRLHCIDVQDPGVVRDIDTLADLRDLP